ncbi:MAG: SIMPL domain-containing protein [Saprospiraceae bacterium]|nr:SIMPL domain-containing protein [Saprospiraceae bacterium]
MSNFKSYWLQKTDILLSKEYQLLVQSAQTAGKVFVELEKIGISNISIERLNHSQIEQFRQEVKINAIKAAKDKAQALAAAIDQSVGKALYVQELDNQFYPVNAVSNIAIRGFSSLNQEGKSTPNIDFEKIKLEYAILVRFELK